MPSNYAGVPSNVPAGTISISEPVDGDPGNASTIQTPEQALTDAAEYLRQLIAMAAVANWQAAAGTAFSAGGIYSLAAGDTQSTDYIVLAVGSSGNTAMSFNGGQTWPNVTAVGASTYLCAECMNGMFFAGGVGGQLATGTPSAGVSNLATRTSNTTHDINALAWNGNAGSPVYVGVGASGDTIRSTDGVTWVKTTVGASDFKGVAFGAGLFVACSANGHIQTSPDGTTWTDRGAVIGHNAGIAPDSLRYAAGLFLNVSQSSGGYASWSTDGIAWTEVALGGPSLVSSSGTIAHNGICWLIIENDAAAYNPPQVLFVSFDGKTWNRRPTSAGSGFLGNTGVFTNTSIGKITAARNGVFLTHPVNKTVVALSEAIAA